MTTYTTHWRIRHPRSPGRIGLILVAAAFLMSCSGGDGAVRAEGSTLDSLDSSVLAAVASADVNGAWVLTQRFGGGEFSVGRFSRDGLEKVADLPAWQGADLMAYRDRALVGGVRCEGEGCGRTVSELLQVSRDGTVSDFAQLGTRDGAPGPADSLVLVGVADEGIWVSDLGGELVLLNELGDVVGGPIQPGGAPCIIESQLFVLRARDELPAVDGKAGSAEQAPSGSGSFLVHEWVDGRLEPVGSSELDEADSAGPRGDCISGGFEVPGGDQASRWTPDTGWILTESREPPDDARSGVARSSNSTPYFVNREGRLTRLGKNGPVETTIRLTIDRAGGPPLGLVVDDTNGAVVACVQAYNSISETNRVECSIEEQE